PVVETGRAPSPPLAMFDGDLICIFGILSVRDETGRAPSPPLAMFDSNLICIFRILSVRGETGHAPSLQLGKYNCCLVDWGNKVRVWPLY
ncbi:hypothetical protein, partial [uncultured Parabacteroides sp.]|uniref:hypothetical protein n=1 Tax=uncultured Parabacteroides sp. TaxID=512312 RepID=UPI0026158A02